MKNKKLLDGIFTAAVSGILIEKVMQGIKWKLHQEKYGKYEDKIALSISFVYGILLSNIDNIRTHP